MSTREERLAVAIEQIERNFGERNVKSPFRQHVATFRSGQPLDRYKKSAIMSFGQGNFDEWCIFIQGSAGYPKVPTDVWGLNFLKSWSEDKSAESIYDDFIQIYDQVGEGATYSHTKPVIELIEQIAFKYPSYIDACVVWTYFYMGMIAEENKKNDKGEKLPLRRRIKRLGVYMVLMEGIQPQVAANYSRGLGADYLDKVCFYRGF